MSALELAAHYVGPRCEHLRDVTPVRVTIKTETFEGIRYTQVFTYLEDERAVSEGGKKVGEERLETSFMLLGALPRTYRLKRISKHHRDTCQAVVYRIGEDDGDWYVTSHYPHDERTPYHPLGRCFMLGRWPHENPWHGRIDQNDDKPRQRLLITVEVVR